MFSYTSGIDGPTRLRVFCYSSLDIETSTTATTAGRQGIVDDLELASNQLDGVINLASFE